MNAKMLRAILENIEDDIDIFVTVDGHDVEVGCMHLNEQEGYIALEPWDAWDDGDADDEEMLMTKVTRQMSAPLWREIQLARLGHPVTSRNMLVQVSKESRTCDGTTA
jgi:hypothetical protein